MFVTGSNLNCIFNLLKTNRRLVPKQLLIRDYLISKKALFFNKAFFMPKNKSITVPFSNLQSQVQLARR